jgi:hypothetical protein
MARKTIDVETIKDWANEQLISDGYMKDFAEVAVGRGYRHGVMNMIENVLMSTDNYKGFRYLSIDEVPAGHLPGIYRNHRDEPVFEDTDNTRVRYF